MPRAVIRAIGILKKASALVNRDLGKLPDLAVAPRIRQRVLAVQAWGDNGFIAVGGTEQSPRSGATWTSPDGITWSPAAPAGPLARWRRAACSERSR